ncbi:stage II sporulation protein R [Alteribacillus sp. HJP-4]|uniref:stage II sporulation protein R n=1 Tax=Alteribacillus sp. HJP-4 TaxID=2775394 RepID=UPI0035CD358D
MRSKALIYVIFLVLISWLHMEQQQNAAASSGIAEVIPEEAVRLRILAHDDSPAEQLIKREVRDEVNAEIRTIVSDLSTKEEARARIAAHVPELERITASVLQKNNASHSFTIQLKENVEFPTRVYGPLVYPAGTYEALVVTIGEGEGENWWCVLFPPLCFIPADEKAEAEEESVDNNSDTVDKDSAYTFFVVEKWKEWFGN